MPDRPNLVRTSARALIVGTVLFAINQFDVVLCGDASVGTWIRAVLSCLVPVTVANAGLIGTRR